MDLNVFFAKLDTALRTEGIACGADIWLRVYQLIERLKHKGPLPEDKQQLMPLLRPLFCRNPEEQARFPILFEQCLVEEDVDIAAVMASKNKMSSPQQAEITNVRKRAQRIERYWWWGGGLLLLAIVTSIAIFISKPPTPEASTREVPTQETADSVSVEPSPRVTTPIKKQSSVSIIDHIPPRLQSEPAPEKKPWHMLLYLIPWFCAAWWLGKSYAKTLVLTRESASSDNLLNQLQFKQPFAPIWGGADAERSLRDLRSARFIPTHRLDVSATVAATAHSGGYFQPVYHTRRTAPEHLILVRGVNRNDQQAGLAGELVERFKALGLEVNAYRFQDDPRWLASWDNRSANNYFQLEQILARHGTARLLVISETDILFHPYSGQARPWLTKLSPWQDKVWLHPRNAHKAHAKLLTHHDFLTLPLARDSLPGLVSHLITAQPDKLAVPDTHSIELPNIIVQEPDGWLGEHPPHGVNLADLEWQLEHFLGTHGLRLLRAIAVYPKPHWELTKALDYLLLGRLGASDPPAQREQRLSRLSRLPWLMHGFLPNWLREHLLIHSDTDEREHVVKAWQSLFSQRTDLVRADALQLNFSTPSKREIKLRWNELRAMKQSDAINDPIFAHILMGGKFGMLDFQLPRELAKRLPFASHTMNLRPALIALAAALLGTLVVHFIIPMLADFELHASRWQVTVQHQQETEALARALQQRLQPDQFQALKLKPVKSSNFTSTTNTIEYAAGGELAAKRIARSLTWLTYGADVNLTESIKLVPNAVQVQLVQTYQHGAGFNDVLNRAKGLSFEPEMVRIKPGTFRMGSPDSKAKRRSDEVPQHEVIIDYPFEIGKYEVTFAEYDVFAKATKRRLPDDEGWGRNNRPVINVSFEDAQAYIKWLSQETDKAYRLPTEAEWEYVARAGSSTVYWWGDQIGKNNAVCSGCGSQWDGAKTAPVGSFQVNHFGLHDTAGNVWEWTQDCWHENYQDAPQDGSAWLEANDGQCDRRVIRGGSWGGLPRNLRSAVRDRGGSGGAGVNLGFRIARDL